VLLLPVPTVIFVGVVTAEVPIGLVVLQVKVVLQVVPAAGIVQLDAVSVPFISPKVAVTLLA
jgi:hypothetical protein